MVNEKAMGDRVLVVDDESDVCRLIAFNLEREGFETQSAGTAADALLAAGRWRPTVVVLDRMLPDLPGSEVCQRLRQDPAMRDTGILMLTALGGDDDRVSGLEAGADDYVVKPFNVREVVLRVRALARRVRELAEPRGGSEGTLLRAGALSVDTRTHEVSAGGRAISLRPLEFKLLITLMADPNRVFTREQLLETVWEISQGGNPRTVDVHVRRLRQNLGDQADVIETVPGFGYRARGSA